MTFRERLAGWIGGADMETLRRENERLRFEYRNCMDMLLTATDRDGSWHRYLSRILNHFGGEVTIDAGVPLGPQFVSMAYSTETDKATFRISNPSPPPMDKTPAARRSPLEHEWDAGPVIDPASEVRGCARSASTAPPT